MCSSDLNNIVIGGNYASNQIIFESAILQDYLESIGNRVLMIDDLSPEFNSNPRSTKYSNIDVFTLSTARYKKYVTFINDLAYADQNQVLLVSLLHDDNYGYLNQYGKIRFGLMVTLYLKYLTDCLITMKQLNYGH